MAKKPNYIVLCTKQNERELRKSAKKLKISYDSF